MSYRSGFLPFYIIAIGFFLLSVGYNIVQHQENKDLQLEIEIYKELEDWSDNQYEYLYLKYLELKQKLFHKDLT